MERQETITDLRTEEEKSEGTGLRLADLAPEGNLRLMTFIEEQGKKRAWEQGVEFSEVDYLMGAYAVLAGLGWAETVPPHWIFGPMRDEPVLLTAAQQRSHRLWCQQNSERSARLIDAVKDALRHAEAAVSKLEVAEDITLGYEDTDGDN